VRKVRASVVNDLGTVPTFAAIVPEGQDLRASLVRGVVTGVSLLMRRRSPIQVHATIPEAAAFVAGQLASQHVTAAEIVSAVAEVRSRIG
jgi:hypothetical protein